MKHTALGKRCLRQAPGCRLLAHSGRRAGPLLTQGGCSECPAFGLALERRQVRIGPSLFRRSPLEAAIVREGRNLVRQLRREGKPSFT
ncbi:MAG: hypothetical protein AVDCRST_MAG93-3333 [uncultured Chloroflexia bacterium]|uniref:Uncharacterized protein n=1 Tax=uncultured Chloroflexia bacterium TaxID=1672391 RepID=A0A6J4JNG5_9CHLR|nr:MAG: hypothetical protein AVDCRST_MAG93-3333 [uncultured Chloroflexia bacterium]